MDNWLSPSGRRAKPSWKFVFTLNYGNSGSSSWLNPLLDFWYPEISPLMPSRWCRCWRAITLIIGFLYCLLFTFIFLFRFLFLFYLTLSLRYPHPISTPFLLPCYALPMPMLQRFTKETHVQTLRGTSKPWFRILMCLLAYSEHAEFKYFLSSRAMFFRLEKLCDAKLRKNRETPNISHVKNTNATPFHLIFASKRHLCFSFSQSSFAFTPL